MYIYLSLSPPVSVSNLKNSRLLSCWGFHFSHRCMSPFVNLLYTPGLRWTCDICHKPQLLSSVTPWTDVTMPVPQVLPLVTDGCKLPPHPSRSPDSSCASTYLQPP